MPAIATSGSRAPLSGWRALISGACAGPRPTLRFESASMRSLLNIMPSSGSGLESRRMQSKGVAAEKFEAGTRGKPTAETPFRRTIQHVPRLHVTTNAENIAQSAAMDGIFPLTTNTKQTPVDVFKIYKYQPRIEKRHALLKSTLEVAPIWLKKNTRVEALMFLEFIAQIVAALIERELRAT